MQVECLEQGLAYSRCSIKVPPPPSFFAFSLASFPPLEGISVLWANLAELRHGWCSLLPYWWRAEDCWGHPPFPGSLSLPPSGGWSPVWCRHSPSGKGRSQPQAWRGNHSVVPPHCTACVRLWYAPRRQKHWHYSGGCAGGSVCPSALCWVTCWDHDLLGGERVV